MIITFEIIAGCKVFAINFAGFSSHSITSILSHQSSSITIFILEPLNQTQAQITSILSFSV
jgi:hypothetical protein